MVESGTNVPTDMLQAIEACYGRCDALVKSIERKLEAQPTPATVYHYTDSEGLLGILESGTIRLTDMFGLNDPSELRHGVNHAREILAAEARGGHPAAKFFADKFNTVMDGGVEASAHFFVACFSHDGDELGQWRAYGDDGKGFALGFDGQLLENAFAKPGGRHVPDNATFPVTYDDGSLREIHQHLVKEVLPLIEMPQGRNLSSPVLNRFMVELSVRLSISVVRAALFFKHEAYKNEQEYRFLQVRRADQPVDNLRHRTRRNSLIRFTAFDWKPKVLPGEGHPSRHPTYRHLQH